MAQEKEIVSNDECDIIVDVEKSTKTELPATEAAPKGGLGIKLAGYLSLLALIFQNASLVLVTRYAAGMKTGGDPFIPASVVVCTEVMKILISLVLVQVTDSRGAINAIMTEMTQHRNSCLQCFVPACFYTLASGLIYYALANMEVTLFQLCTQSKVLLTAGWSIVLLGSRFSLLKWIALITLALGIVMCSWNGSKSADNSTKEQNVTFGLICTFVGAMSASFGGVYFEKLLKKDERAHEVDLWMRNIFLSWFSLLFGIGGYYLSTSQSGIVRKEIYFFQGFDMFTWTIVVLQAAGGIIVAMCVKFADNVLKGFAKAFSIILVAIVSWWLFGFQPTFIFVIGGILVTSATFLYSI
eukprot:TRINITY_DN20843_c0_g1_i1.p1 TRINITY_DN20843_c0_g1~~TRINITY_DN20843_c0_g1_i1.p1  ORF type:complete len:355 (+),score=49.52 TRINITY_DN20843_c0_g1_i1:62-1126(+)